MIRRNKRRAGRDPDEDLDPKPDGAWELEPAPRREEEPPDDRDSTSGGDEKQPAVSPSQVVQPQ